MADELTAAPAEPKAGRRNRAEDEGTIRGIRQQAQAIVAGTYALGVADDPLPEPASREPQPQDVSSKSDTGTRGDGDAGTGRQDEAEPKRDMDPNVGGGVDRDKLADADFVFGDSRTFPVVVPGDVEDAVSSWGRYQGPHDFAEFQRRLTALCQRKGPAFVAKLPASWQQAAKSIEFHLSLGKAFAEPGDPDTLLVEGYASTAVVDRTRDRIFPEAFRKGLDAYRKNPVVLLNHDVTKPIGKVLEAAIDEVGLRVKVAIDRSLTWGREAAKMIERGILNAFSVRAVDDLAEGWVDATGVRNITNWDLREISVVAVPAHQQALFSVAKALTDGTDLIDAAQPAQSVEGKMSEEKLAPDTTAQFDEEALIAKAVAHMEAKQKALADAAAAKAAERAEWEASLRKQWEAEQATAAAKNLPPFPVVDLAGNHLQGAGADQMRKLGRLIVGSKFDRLGDLDLVMRYYMQSQAAKAGRAPQPSERFMRAVMTRAAKFMQAEDELPHWEPYAGARPKMLRVPAFDPSVVQPYVAGAEDTADVIVNGKVLAQNVRFDDHVSAAGVSQLLEIGAKSDELIYSTQSGYGDQWVPTLMSAMLWRTIRLNSAVLPLFDQFDMPSQPYDYPTESTDPTFYTVAESANEAQLVVSGGPFSDSKVGTAKTTFTAGKLGALSYWSEEMNEDSIIGIEPQLRNQYGISLAHAIDRVLISGDKAGGSSSTNISYYGSAESAAAWYATLNGLRHEPLVTTAADSRDAGTLTIDDVPATRALMGTAGRYGADPSQLSIICDIATGLKFGALSEVLTVDKFGPQATILTGQQASVFGIPIIASQDYDLTDSSGYINATGGSNTKGQFLIVNRLGWKVGWRRRPRIFVGQVPFSDAWYIMGTARLDLQPFAAGMAGLSYNVTI